MELHGLITKWIDLIGKMKNNLAIALFLLVSYIVFSQESYRKDSLQIKVYTSMVVNENLRIESIDIVKVFCDYCNDVQIEQIKIEALKRTKSEIYNPKYQKQGVYKLAHYLRISKKDFSELKEDN